MGLAKRRLRILVVEDDARVRSYLADALADIADVLEAGDIRQALEELSRPERRRGLDVVIVDCVLPTVTESGVAAGIDLLRTIRARWPWLRLIAITGVMPSEELIIDAFRSGARDFLRKPFGVAELIATVTRIVSGRGARARPGHPPDDQASFKRALALIDENYTEPLSLKDLADLVGMTRTRFARTFRALRGVSLRDYVRTLRLEHAQQLLLSQRSVTEVALEAGFYDLPHFDKAFRKRFGVAPKEFQRRKGLAWAGETRQGAEPDRADAS